MKKKTLYQKLFKRGIDIIFSLSGLIFSWPIFLLIAISIKTSSPGSVIFKQRRVGKDGEVFTLYKFRTMVKNAEKLKIKYLSLNEADGPVFKIKNDPRYTKFGKILSHSGLDELPQLLNILKGEMSLVGPRPLPVEEEALIPKKWQNKRRSVRPGLFSPWTATGARHSSFEKWMKSDIDYLNKNSFSQDFFIILKTTVNLFKKQFFLLRKKSGFF